MMTKEEIKQFLTKHQFCNIFIKYKSSDKLNSSFYSAVILFRFDTFRTIKQFHKRYTSRIRIKGLIIFNSNDKNIRNKESTLNLQHFEYVRLLTNRDIEKYFTKLL